MKMSIGVDLHKTQFTVCFLSEDRTIKENGFYPTTDKGYEAFLEKAMSYESHGFELRLPSNRLVIPVTSETGCL
jgi:predicted NBD/HSP70 family sugar kinase